MDELLREFLAEAEELIETLFGDIERLGEQHGEGRTRRELTNRIFRHVHTLKGTAAASGLDATTQLAHEFETLLDAVRKGRVTITKPVLDAFEDASQALSQTLTAASRGETLMIPLPLLENLQRLAGSADEAEHVSHDDVAARLALLPAEIARILGADEAQRLREAVAEGQHLFLLHAAFELETFEQNFRELSAAVALRGELISTLPAAAEAAPGAINLRLLCASEASGEELSALVASFARALIEELKPAAATRRIESDAALNDEGATADDATALTIAPLTMQVRVELGKLDELINAAHELLTETTTALDLTLEETTSPAVRRDLEARVTRIQNRFIKLEEQLIALRRVPLSQALERVARAGRQAARATGKDINVEIKGGDVRLDKSLVEAISVPLLHLIRNAVGHGIESAVERTGAGKDARGTVLLEALAEDDRVLLKITDDGRGVNLEGVARAAIERGIVEAGQSVTRHQALRLIFRPGFSTAPVVSKMSGRGVGLDVVERAVEQVGGEMRVWSESGRGTTFEMIVPTTLALLSALVVSSAGFSYCLDARHISETLWVASEEIERTTERESIALREARLPLVSLRKLLGQPSVAAAERAKSLPVIIVSRAKNVSGTEPDKAERTRVAVQVDEWIEGRTEVLVRRLGAHGLRWPFVSGAAELSDGKLALVLDLQRLLEAHAEER